MITERSGVSRAEAKRALGFDDSLGQADRERIEARDAIGERHSDFRAVDVRGVDARRRKIGHQLRLHRRRVESATARRAAAG